MNDVFNLELSSRTILSGKSELLSRVQTTLNKISKQVISVSAFNCGAYNRALMYLEYKNKITDQVIPSFCLPNFRLHGEEVSYSCVLV